MVPTVERGLRDVDFWSMDTAGDRPSMKSTSGLSIWPRNCRAYDDRDSTYRRWPSAKIVSNARLDLPEPDSPVNTIMALRGRSRLTSRRLCSRAPRMIRRSDTQTSPRPDSAGIADLRHQPTSPAPTTPSTTTEQRPPPAPCPVTHAVSTVMPTLSIPTVAHSCPRDAEPPLRRTTATLNRCDPEPSRP